MGAWASLAAQAASLKEISNAVLTVRYDEAAKSFSIIDRKTGGNAICEGKLDGVCTVAGHTMVSEQADGSLTLELRGDQPFVFVTKELHNSGAAEMDVPKVVPLTFSMDLGKPANELRTLGTAGLLEPDKNPGSYLFLTCADPATRHGVVAGWLTEDRGSGVMFSGVKDGKVEMKAQIDYGHLRIAPGKTEKLETLAIGYFEDARIGSELYAGLIRQHYDIKLRPRAAVYCTWYAEKHGQAGDEKSTVELADFAAKQLKPYGFGVVQIDDEWQDGQGINGPRRGFDRVRPGGPYANGIAPVAAAVNKTGLTFGLWWLPFGRNFQDAEYKDRQDWFVKRPDGQPYDTPWGGTCLDLTHPKVQTHLAQISKLYRSWGVKYYKMDGLSTGAACDPMYVNDGYKDDHLGNHQPFHDPSVSNIEAFRSGLKLIRKHAGDDVFFSGCCASQNMRSLGGSIGLVDAMRIGPDAGGDIRAGSLRGSRLYFLNGRVWWNDPDPVMMRSAGGGLGGGAVSADIARLTTSWVALSGQFFLLSDWLPDLAAERIEILKRTMLSHNATSRPVDYFDNELPRIWHVEQGPRHVLGLYNWENQPQTLGATLAKSGLDPSKTYYAYDFWKNELLPDIKDSFSYELPPTSCKVVALRADEGHPVVLSTSRHVTQGMVDLTNEQWAQGVLSGTSEVIANDPYELRIRVPAGWKLQQASAPTSGAAGLIRMQLKTTDTAKVNWKVAFIREK
jgi:hypothetical protein